MGRFLLLCAGLLAVSTEILPGGIARSVAAPPKVNYLFPAGACRASSVVITASGDFTSWPIQAWANAPGITVAPETEKGKFKASVAADVPAGLYWIRCFDKEGASSPRPFIVGNLPEHQETEPNDAPEKPQTLTAGAIVNGRLAKSGDVDGYAMKLQAGQTLVAAVHAHTDFGAPMDAVLQVCALVEQPVVPGGPSRIDTFVLEQVDDTVGIDPLIVFPVPRDGAYLVRVFAFPQEPTSTIGFAGGENFLYRLTLTTGGFIDHARPLAVQAGASAEVELSGWNIPESDRKARVTAGSGDAAAIASHPELASFARLTTVTTPVLDYRSAAQTGPQQVTIPIAITGQLEAPRQRDEFVFQAVMSKALRLRAESRTHGFAVDPVLLVLDSTGKILAENDDGGGRRDRDLDPTIVFNPPADGEYRALVRDAYGHGSLRHVYQLIIEPVAPDFAVTVAADSYVVAAGKTVEIPLTVERRDGFAEAIEFHVEGLPEGITASAVKSEKEGESAKAVKVTLKADAGIKDFNGPITIRGTAAGPPPLSRSAVYKLGAVSAERSDVWLTANKAS